MSSPSPTNAPQSKPAVITRPHYPRPWETTNPFVSGLLAFVIPGGGHFYQGRFLKGVIYCVCIMGLFIWGNKLGEGMVIYNVPEKTGPMRYVSLSYAAQLGVGAAALPSFYQNRVSAGQRAEAFNLMKPMKSSFEGRIAPAAADGSGRLIGEVSFEPREGDIGPETRGVFRGTLDGEKTEFNLGGHFRLEKQTKGGFRRKLICGIDDEGLAGKIIDGSIPRPFIDAYGSPPDPEQLQEINGRLGKIYELALVFTWIAGLLNVLAFWDCLCGPAYGFGDEHLYPEPTDTVSATK